MSHDPPSIQAMQAQVHREARRLRPILINGIYLGALMILILFGGLVAANRIPSLEPYALERNAASYGALVILMLIPVIRFLKRPIYMYFSSIVSWSMFSLAYYVAGFYFRNLFDVLRPPLQVFVEGCVVYGLLAVVIWVATMVLYARRHPIAPRRRRSSDVTFHNRS